MLILVALIAAIFAIILYNKIQESNKYNSYQITLSDNHFYSSKDISAMASNEIIAVIDEAQIHKKPVLLYFYTSWCKYCQKQLPIINELARKFQNTDLKILFINVDRDASYSNTESHLSSLEKVYFKPYFLSNKSNFLELLRTKSISFKGTIPFFSLIGRDSAIIFQKSGYRSLKFLNKNAMKALFQEYEY